MFGTFRPPLLKKSNAPNQPLAQVASNLDDSEPPTKKRKTGDEQKQSAKPAGPHLVFKAPGISSLPRDPLLKVDSLSGAPPASESVDGGVEGYYNVLWYMMRPTVYIRTM